MTYVLGNGQQRLNAAGQMVLNQVTPRDIDPDGVLSYTVQRDGSFAFENREDYEAALANLRALGYRVGPARPNPVGLRPATKG